MNRKEKDSQAIREELFVRYPALCVCKDAIEAAYEALHRCYDSGGKVLVAGNGGSASDSEHIVGELMKSFLFKRKIDSDLSESLQSLFQEAGVALADKLEGALPAVTLTSMAAISTAFANDVDAAMTFAQMVNGLGEKRDALLVISTSGNAQNVLYALMTAKAKGMTTIALTGLGGGKCKALADITVCAPETETFKIQEYHLPIYHALCAMLEADFFEMQEK